MLLEAQVLRAGEFGPALEDLARIQQGPCLAGPSTVEEGVLQGGEIFPCHVQVAVDDVGLGEPPVAAGALLEVRNGFLRLEGEPLGGVHHPELPVNLTRAHRTGESADELRKQSVGTVLEIVELVVFHPAGLREGQVQAGDGGGIVGILPVGLHHDAVPHVHPDHEVVAHPFFLVPVGGPDDQPGAEGGDPEEQAHAREQLPLGGALFHRQIGKGGYQHGADGRYPQHAGEEIVETVIMDTGRKPGEGIGDQVVRDQRAEDCQRHENDGGGPGPEPFPDEYVDEDDQDGYEGDRAASQVKDGNQEGFHDAAGQIPGDAGAKGGGAQRQGKGDGPAHQGAFVAVERSEGGDGDKGQGVDCQCPAAANSPGKHLNTAQEHGQDGRSGGRIVAELREEPSKPVGESAGNGGYGSEVVPGAFEKLVLLLEMQVVGIFQGEETVQDDAGKQRQGGACQPVESGHRINLCMNLQIYPFWSIIQRNGRGWGWSNFG